jgi:N-methylhydantoinase A
VTTASLRVGVDVGGTFTDGVAVDDRGRIAAVRKESSTPPRVEEGALRAVRALLGDGGIALLVHGTTVATNALIERRLGRVGLLATEGFRDVLAIGSQMRPDLYDVMQRKPEPLVPRRLRLDVPERIGADGRVIRPLDEEAVVRAARRFARERVEAVAVSFLFSNVDARHERRARDILRTELPGVEIALSSEVAPMIREFPRTSTTTINAGLRPILSTYIRELERRAGAPTLVLQSDGGVLPASEAATAGHRLLLSGPAGGVVGAAALGGSGVRDLVTMDMGGTSFDTCLVLDGRPSVRGESAVAGWPVLASAIDLVTVGAGGGSIARVDAGGALIVGPESAGAVPGPACYGLGGVRPTVTDANLVLGRLDPELFLGGRIALDVEAAERAVHDHVARPLDAGLDRAAHAVVEVASATMARALRVVTVGRGRDPERLPLVAFGGAGPLHAAALAIGVGGSRVIVPRYPGYVSAIGLLATELRTEVAETILRPGAQAATPAAISRSAGRLARVAVRRLGTERDRATLLLSADCRYAGQGYELTVPLEEPTAAGLRDMAARFHVLHDAVYGHSAPGEPVELVSLRVTAVAEGAGFRPVRIAERPDPDPAEVRKAWDGRDRVDVLVFERASLPAGWSTNGPLLVQEDESVTWVPAGWSIAVDAVGSLEMTRRDA